MKTALTITVFGLSLFLGYISFLAPYYVRLFNPNTLIVVHDKDITESECSGKFKESYCAKKYSINISQYLKTFDSLAVGTGNIIYATKYFCDDVPLNVEFDDIRHPGKLFDTFGTYQTVNLNGKSCSQLSIEAWVHNSAVRKGRIGGQFVVGEASSVERVKRLSEFFSQELSLIFSFCFLFLLIISYQVKKSLVDIKDDFLDSTIFIWLLCSFSNSGIIQLFIPYSGFPTLNNRLGAAFILLAFTVPYIFRYIDKKSILLLSKIVLFSIFIYLMSTNEFSKYFATSIVLISLLGFASVIVRFNLELLMLSFSQLLCALKLYGFPHMPNAMFVYFYIGILAILRLFYRMNISANFSQLISYVSKLTISPHHVHQDISDLVSKACQLTGLVRPTILRILPDSKIKIYQFYGENKEFFVDSIPPVFSYSMSLQKEVWHLRVGSPEFKRIKKIYNNDPITDEYLCVIPISDEEKVYGALAFTGYSKEYVNDTEFSIEQRAIVRILSDNLRTLIKAENSSIESVWVNKTLDLISNINELGIDSLAHGYKLNRLTNKISEVLECSVFIAELDHSTRRLTIHGISNFDPSVEERYIRGNVFAHFENEQGPIALAVNKKQAVIVSDVRLLKDVIHENTVLFFEKNHTLSCAGIPIYLKNSSEVWGVIWMERRQDIAPFNLLAEGPLMNLSKSISQYIDLQDKEKQITESSNTLRKYIPEHIFDDVLKYNKNKEPDHGYMIMLDLKGSTKISLEKGSDFWLNAAAKLLPKFKNLALNYGLQLQEYKWDAFIFTLTAEKKTTKAMSAIFEFYSCTAKELEAWYSQEFSSISTINQEKHQKARCCVTFGDTSRGFSEGTTKVWTMIGSEIAAVTKMEDVCKKLQGVLFFDQSAIDNTYATLFIDTQTIVAGTGRGIFRYKCDWSDLMRKDEKKAA